MWRARIENESLSIFVHLLHVDHTQIDLVTVNGGLVFAVHCQKVSFFMGNANISGKSHYTPSSIATHAPFPALSIVIYHFKIVIFCVLEQHDTIGSYPKPPIAKPMNQIFIFPVKIPLSVVNQNQVIAGPLVFVKFYFLHDRLENLLEILYSCYSCRTFC